jgi:hypothetical protein
MEIQPSNLYQRYISSLGWNVTLYKNIPVYIKTIPFTGKIAKVQRSLYVPDTGGFTAFLKKNGISTLAFEPDSSVRQDQVDGLIAEIRICGIRINRYPFLPTKTIRINTVKNGNGIFSGFSEAKRRAVRRALKNNVIVKESGDIRELIRIKNKSAGFLGFITTFGINKLWPVFAPENARIILAYEGKESEDNLVGGVLILLYDKISYYWIAGATGKGKKLFAPTLLVWEALKLSNKYHCGWFDFVGVWDERFPRDNRTWLGFTKFKEGFGGQPLYYPVAKG